MQSLQPLVAGDDQGTKPTKRIKISSGILGFPTEILNLHHSLEMLDLSGNPLSQLPKEINRLHKLKIAFFSDCNFATFPRELAKCRSLEMVAFKGNNMTTIPDDAFPRKLRWLILTNNRIKYLPKSIGRCHQLQKCMLAGNQLTTLPDEMVHCQQLGLLRISANRFRHLPEWIFGLPKLSFLAFAGNPCAPSFDDNPALDNIPWAELSIDRVLGEGASGIISQGGWKSPFGYQNVAIKLFKGEVTSDGSPIDEMNACITAGQHPNLIDPIGKIHGHPEKRGLVLQLVPQRYINLGLPPTFDTCTRDTFCPGTILSVEKCKAILTSVASAAVHLHEKEISHGDLYAHNILSDDSGHAFLGDFGAATIYKTMGSHGREIQSLEVLAFGHLIEDLLGLVECADGAGGDLGAQKNQITIGDLSDLHYRCANPVVTERPLFQEVHNTLISL
ncbi:hypothetical protein B7494_g3565 [Chlorociboria aeruginascens]|nr:hypothetical protein B7494_g3565 [Chlorociboria aeruginascens]